MSARRDTDQGHQETRFGSINQGENEKYLVCENGAKRIKELLSSMKPEEAIETFQTESQLDVPNAAAIYNMAGDFGLSRSALDSSVFEAVRKAVLSKIQSTRMSPGDYRMILDATVHYLSIEELQAIPLMLLRQRPSEIPANILAFIKENSKVYDQCSLEIKQVLWQSDISMFEDYMDLLIQRYCQDFDHEYDMSGAEAQNYVQKRRRQQSLADIGNAIGRIYSLYMHLLKMVRNRYLETGDDKFCILRLEITMWMHDKDITEIIDEDVCHRLAWALDACVSQNSLEDRQIREIKKFFDSIPREDQAYADISMILNVPYVRDLLARHIMLRVCNPSSSGSGNIEDDRNVSWASAVINLGAQAHNILVTKRFKIPRLDRNTVYILYRSVSESAALDRMRAATEQADRHSNLALGRNDSSHLYDPPTLAVDSMRNNEVARRVLYQYVLNRAASGDLHALEAWLPAIVAAAGQFFQGVSQDSSFASAKKIPDPDPEQAKDIANPLPKPSVQGALEYVREIETFLRTLRAKLVQRPSLVSFVVGRAAELSSASEVGDSSRPSTVHSMLELFFDKLVPISAAAHCEWVRFLISAQEVVNVDISKSAANVRPGESGGYGKPLQEPINLKAIVLLHRWAERSAAYGCVGPENEGEIRDLYAKLEAESYPNAFSFRIHRSTTTFVARIVTASRDAPQNE